MTAIAFDAGAEDDDVDDDDEAAFARRELDECLVAAASPALGVDACNADDEEEDACDVAEGRDSEADRAADGGALPSERRLTEPYERCSDEDEDETDVEPAGKTEVEPAGKTDVLPGPPELGTATATGNSDGMAAVVDAWVGFAVGTDGSAAESPLAIKASLLLALCFRRALPMAS